MNIEQLPLRTSTLTIDFSKRSVAVERFVEGSDVRVIKKGK